jgi:hypothetical protein
MRWRDYAWGIEIVLGMAWAGIAIGYMLAHFKK